MKIAILTQPLRANYGGILQNYALQQVLKKMGHEPYTFDLGLYTWKDWFIITSKCIIKRIIGMSCSFPETPINRKKKEKILRRFVDKHISLVSPRCDKPSKKYILEYDLQAIVVGSDQVWRPKYNYPIEKMFLNFAQSLNIKRVAYAASFGTSDWEYKEEQLKICKQLVQQFDAISVREDSGVELCKKYLNVSATHVLDPTLLLTKDDYNKLIADIPTAKDSYLFAYILDEDQRKRSFIAKIAKEKNLVPVILGAGKELKDDDSIETWVAYFRDAKYVITDSFHGTVFSIIYNKDFIVIENMHRGLSRMYSLLKMFNLFDHIVTEVNVVARKSFSKKIDWSYVNDIWAKNRSESTFFLMKNL